MESFSMNDFESEEYGCITHEMMYGSRKGFCRACDWLLPSHETTCPCNKIRASVLVLAKEQGIGELRKNFLKQRIFPSNDVRSPMRVIKRNPATKPKPQDKREMKWCSSCDAQRLSIHNGTRWQCMRCSSGS